MKLVSISMAAALALCAGASFAQPAPQGPPTAEGHRFQRPDPAQMAERHAQRLRDALQLRPDQEPALRALVAAAQPPPGAHARMGREPEDGAKLTTPERLDRLQARMAEHQQRFQVRAAALKRFYAQLSPTQQKAFDAMPMPGMGGHGRHGQHGRPGPGEHRHGPRGPGGPGAPPPAP
jgi:hypothetical protein